MATTRRVFVSHVHEEAALATLLRKLVIVGFKAHGVTAFLSSDRESLPAGGKWLDVVRTNLAGSEVLIALIGPESLKRPWPNIELGAAWIKDITVIPFCHSGIHASDLPRPFSDFHAVDIDANDPARDLLGNVAHALKIEHCDYSHSSDFKRDFTAAAQGVKYESERGTPAVAQGPE
jgi:hypothetical protein